MKNLPKIMIVEDNKFYSNLLEKELLKDKIGSVEAYYTGEDFMNNLFKMPDIVLLDHHLGSMKGIDVLKQIKSINPNIQVIFLSAQEKLHVAISALKYGAYDYVEKNDSALIRVKALIKRISKHNNLIREQKHFKAAKIAFTALVASFFLLAIYLQF
ncbi:MAG: DNA-binding NtrC family response regulator [Flavobacteriales bacterium]|jgi:DNA-binding NtrC family response regulator